ncbi:alpha/beta hydrolase [Methylobacterium sp. Leaf85]|uniref:alpha/beta hydrolase n=1 Tax=Methylobacterium sp. Leaf85 TaxID=1736241 RepID=UPI0009ECBE4E|nr:alpha/beta hydrolase [Methylobacterium sp. Leaf85]
MLTGFFKRANFALLLFAAISFSPALAQVSGSAMNNPALLAGIISKAVTSGDRELLISWLSESSFKKIENNLGERLISESVLSLGRINHTSNIEKNITSDGIDLKLTTYYQRGKVKWKLRIDLNSKKVNFIEFYAVETSFGGAVIPTSAHIKTIPRKDPTTKSREQYKRNIKNSRDYKVSSKLRRKHRGISASGGFFANYNENTLIIGRVPPVKTASSEENSEKSRHNPLELKRNDYGAESAVIAKEDAKVKPAELSETEKLIQADADTSSAPSEVQLLFATTRKPSTSKKDIAYFSGDRGEELSFGSARVSVPIKHFLGQAERPMNWTFFGFEIYAETEKDSKHFIIKQASTVDQSEFEKIINESGSDEALIFVHGFNNSFEDAIFRTAQIAWDLQYKGLPILFSWASRGVIGDYLYDRESAQIARPSFIKLLQMLKNETSIKKVHILAHSMGNLLALDALSSSGTTITPLSVGQFIMAAPDVDREQFMQMIPSISKIAQGMTLYASSEDKALKFSKALFKAPRAGDLVLGTPIILPRLESIDVSVLGDEILGLNHNVFSSSKSVMNDIKLLLAGSLPPRLIEVRGQPRNAKPPQFWRYVP